MIDTIVKQHAHLGLDDLDAQTDPEGVYLPSREKITQECREIRDDWSDREHRKRASEPKVLRWMPPMIHLDPDIQGVLPD